MERNSCAKLIFFICIMFKYCYSFTIFTEKVAKIDRFEGYCAGQENLPMTFHNLSFAYNGRKMMISGKLIVKHDLNNQFEQIMALTRCRHRDSLDSCEKYNNMRFSRCCDLIDVKGQIWSPFIDSIAPRIRCPIKAGLYSLDNATLDANIALFPVEGWYWRINIKSFDLVTKEQLLCMNMEAEIKTVKKN